LDPSMGEADDSTVTLGLVLLDTLLVWISEADPDEKVRG
jgi:hypothetical protein